MHSLSGKWFLPALMFFLAFRIGIAQDMTPGIIEIRKEVADSIGVFYFYDTARNIISPYYYQLDTSLHHFHHYQALQHNGRIYASLGNTGLAYTALTFENYLNPENQYGIKSYDAYRFTPDKLPYYKLNIPFTVLAYTTGKDREQVFKGSHYQQVRKGLGVGLDFNIYNSMGSYMRQKSDNVSLAFKALYRSQNKRYGVAGNFINNRFVHRENGGISNPSQFEDNLETDRGRVTIRINNAENRYRESNTYFKQYFHLSKPKAKKNDSISTAAMGLGTIMHKFNYQRLAQVYDDRNPRSGYYQEILIDSTRTTDSLVLHNVYNEFQWNLPLIETGNIGFEITTGLGHTFMHYRMFQINKKFNQIIPFFNPELRLGSRLLLAADYRRITGDFRNGDQDISLLASYSFGTEDPFILSSKFKRSMSSPGLFYHYYQSNHFEWYNDFSQQRCSEIELSVRWRTNRVGLSISELSGLAYLNESAQPAWSDSQINLIKAFASSKIHWRRFTVDNKIFFQQLSDQTILRLPKLIVNSTFSYELDLFQGALQAMGGFEVFYNSPWRAPAYMPALRSFYLQNETETGNYLYADVFINLRIKRARIFLLMQHINQGLLDYNYYMIPGYPMPDRAFKLGVNWMFYD